MTKKLATCCTVIEKVMSGVEVAAQFLVVIDEKKVKYCKVLPTQ